MKISEHALDYYIIFCFIMMLLYAIAEFTVSSYTGMTHDTLTVAWFAAHGGEVFACAMIKKFKLKETEGEVG